MEAGNVLLNTSFRSLFEDEPAPLLRRYYLACGCICAVTTNSEEILEAVQQTLTPVAASSSTVDVELRLWVDDTVHDSPPWPPPYFRGLQHLVFAALGAESAVLVDLRRRQVSARVSRALAADHGYWRRVIMPALFGIVSPTIGLAGLHCACVERGGRGLLLAGESGSGKSTLSLALAQSGFSFLTDDWTYLSRSGTRLRVWALPAPLKLLADAQDRFPELADQKAAPSLNGEMAYEVEPDRVFRVRRALCAEPRWLIFLRRGEAPGVTLDPMSAVDAAARFEADLECMPAPVSGNRDFLVKTIRILSQLPCWQLRYGGNAHAVAETVAAFMDSGGEALCCRETELEVCTTTA